MAKKNIKNDKKQSKNRKIDPYKETTKEDFPEIFKKAFGNVTNACLHANIDRTTYYRWRDDDPEFAAKCNEAYEYQDDFVESKMMSLIQQGNTQAIIHYVKTKLAKRGYGLKFEKTGPDGAPLPEIKDDDPHFERFTADELREWIRLETLRQTPPKKDEKS